MSNLSGAGKSKWLTMEAEVKVVANLSGWPPAEVW